MPDIFSQCLQDVLNGQALTPKQAQELLVLLPQKFTAIIALAGMANKDKKPFTCGIINAKSGHCTEDCAFCSQSLYNVKNSTTYDLISDEVIYKHACLLAEQGVHRMGIVTSGAKPNASDFEKLCLLSDRIIKNTGLKLCASLGLLENDQAKSLKQSGISSYHHNLEASRSFYPSICSTHSYDLRENTIKVAKDNDLRTCSGGLFGMGESWKQRLELSKALQKLDVDSIPINFLIPMAGTRLENAVPLKAQETLTIIAIMRLMHPHKDIIVCGGRAHNLGEWDNSIFFAGANGVMVGDYLTTKGSPFERDMEILETLGFRNNKQ